MDDLNETKLSILNLLKSEKLTTKELAKKTNTTMANISQQLKNLEFMKLVKKTKNTGTGSRAQKDRRVFYELLENKLYIKKISSNYVGYEEIKNDSFNDFLSNLMLTNFEGRKHLLKFFLTLKDTSNMESLALLNSQQEEIHILIISKEIKYFREKSSEEIEVFGVKKKLVFWSHTFEEFLEGVEKKDEYFLEKLSNAKVLIDKKTRLGKLK